MELNVERLHPSLTERSKLDNIDNINQNRAQNYHNPDPLARYKAKARDPKQWKPVYTALDRDDPDNEIGSAILGMCGNRAKSFAASSGRDVDDVLDYLLKHVYDSNLWQKENGVVKRPIQVADEFLVNGDPGSINASAFNSTLKQIIDKALDKLNGNKGGSEEKNSSEFSTDVGSANNGDLDSVRSVNDDNYDDRVSGLMDDTIRVHQGKDGELVTDPTAFEVEDKYVLDQVISTLPENSRGSDFLKFKGEFKGENPYGIHPDNDYNEKDYDDVALATYLGLKRESKSFQDLRKEVMDYVFLHTGSGTGFGGKMRKKSSLNPDGYHFPESEFYINLNGQYFDKNNRIIIPKGMRAPSAKNMSAFDPQDVVKGNGHARTDAYTRESDRDVFIEQLVDELRKKKGTAKLVDLVLHGDMEKGFPKLEDTLSEAGTEAMLNGWLKVLRGKVPGYMLQKMDKLYQVFHPYSRRYLDND